MQNCVKLVDENMQICDAALEYLVEQNDFVVVGVIGEQCSGKSYIMSALAGRYVLIIITFQLFLHAHC